jgi:hypothetical protein
MGNLNTKIFGYFKSASHYWLGIGTIVVLYGSFMNGELSLRYFFAVLVLWGLIVGIPSFILYEVGRRMERRSQGTQPDDEYEEA